MKKKGFTLVELLAVIVILSIIAVILVPVINNVIESAKAASAKSSAQGYIDAVKNRIALTILGERSLEGMNYVRDIDSEIEYNGKRIEKGIIIVENDTLKEAKICVNNYSFRYYNDKLESTTIDYCTEKSEIEISILGSAIKETLVNEYSYSLDLSSYDISSSTNMVCNNSALPSINDNTLTIENIYGDTKCSINSSIVDTINDLDDTITNIVMLNDETIDSTLTILEGKTVNLDLNGNMIRYQVEEANDNTAFIINNGLLNMDDNTGLGIINTDDVGIRNDTGIINLSNFRINASRLAVYSPAKTPVKLTNMNVHCTGTTNQCVTIGLSTDGITILDSLSIVSDNIPGLWFGQDGIANITGKIHIKSGKRAIVNNGIGTINIIQEDQPIYLTSTSTTWNTPIANLSTGIIKIKASQANDCTNNSASTTSGLCVYAPGDNDYNNSQGNGAVANGGGMIYIDGGTYNADMRVIFNNAKLSINIINAKIIGGKVGAVNGSAGTINICNSVINVTVYDIANDVNYSTGTINYDSYTIFTNGDNIPVFANNTGTINSNYTGTCTQ